MELALIIIYGLFLSFIFLYSLVQLSLALAYVRSHRKNDDCEQIEYAEGECPSVTIQLPVFNELYVVERLIESVAKLDYPRDKFEIQVLDDSDDESFDVAAKKVKEIAALGINISHVKRPERVGYKAGALAYGLTLTTSDFTAIFDADFIPQEDFLKQTMPFFRDEKVGVVQTRWEHLNKDYSLLTKLQAFGLDAHFTVEQTGRNSQGHFINFNGTAGVWRNACIEEAGGWQHDTITEDLDLSYRAQLKGWKFKYLEGVGSPAELPAEMNALKNQQFRWTKGAAECAVKNLPKVLRQKGLSLGTKLHATFHLMNSFIFICVLFTALLSVPLLVVKHSVDEFDFLFNLASIFLLSFVILAFFYWVSQRNEKKGFGRFLLDFPMFLSMSMGLSLHNAIAVIEGYAGRKTPFIRTPKFAIEKQSGSWTDKKYRALKTNPLTLLEGVLMLYFIGGVVYAFWTMELGLLPFHIMLSLGYGYVFFYSIKHARVNG
ncbi:MAG: cellulose synthase/poly-beta-1,6-N-acetylglucosamine synthase-like glycosyltransferase [Litorivivens sp.]